jgi:hypothetical protein
MSAVGVMTSRDLPGTIEDQARERLLRREVEAIEAERKAELEERRPALIAAVQKAADGVRFNEELVNAQQNVAEAVARVESALGALRAIRSDDKAARLNFKRAKNAAIREGVPADELPNIAPEVSKMPDVNGWPGCGEGAWTSSWGRG